MRNHQMYQSFLEGFNQKVIEKLEDYEENPALEPDFDREFLLHEEQTTDGEFRAGGMEIVGVQYCAEQSEC